MVVYQVVTQVFGYGAMALIFGAGLWALWVDRGIAHGSSVAPWETWRPKSKK